MLKKSLKLIALITLILSLAIPLTGCRESLVIAKVLHDQNVKETQKNEYQVDQDPETDEEDEELPDMKEDEDDDKNTEQKLAGAVGNTSNGVTTTNITDPDSSNDKKANKSGDNKGDKKNKKSSSKTSGDGDGDTKSGGKSGGQGGSRQIYDDSGKVIDLPDKVNKVVAPGEAAVIVQMLGGKGILKGSSESILNDSLFKQVFSDEGISNAKTYWSGDGSSPMSTESFSALLKSKPDACVVVGGQSSFTATQITQLQAHDIAYVTIPALDSAAHITKAVSTVGTMIGNRSSVSGGVNAKKLASTYSNYCGNLLKTVSRKAGSATGNYCLYIPYWNTAATLTLPEVSLAETGLGYTNNSSRAVTEYLKKGGVTDNTSTYTMTDGTDYAVIPLNINVQKNATVSGGLSELDQTSNRSFVKNSSYNLGKSSHFHYVITASSQITAYIRASQSSSTGMWRSYPKTKYPSGRGSDYGFVFNNTLIRTNIEGDYEILTNPYGVGSWASGSCESFLESIWAAWKITGACTETEVKTQISDFYSTFYRHNLTSSQLNTILAGK